MTLDDPASAIADLQAQLNRHVANNKQSFSDVDDSLAQLQETVSQFSKGKTMDATSGNLKIHNHIPGTDNMSTMLAAMMGTNRPGTDGLFGAGGGILGGLLLGTLLRNGGLFGGNGGGMTDVTQPPANMSIMSTLGDIKQAVAVGTAQMETSQALQSSTIQAQLSSVAAAQTANTNGVKDAVNGNTVALMNMINSLQTTITNDGDKTRALATNQYEAALNRQLSDANAAIIELRSEMNGQRRSRDSEVVVTQTVNQAQAQSQQQQQLQVLREGLNSLIASHQNLQQGIVNLGTMSGSAGTQTASNTRVN